MTIEQETGGLPMPVLPGYALEGMLGRGGMGVVYRAQDLRSGGLVALKVLQHVSAAGIYRLKREFRSLADIAHPNLVLLHELSCAEQTWFLTMELVDGVALSTYLGTASIPVDTVPDPRQHRLSGIKRRTDAAATRSSPATELARLRAVFAQLLHGIAAIHRAGKLHCDVKPSNVLIERTGRLVLLDFGLISDQTTALDTPALAASDSPPRGRGRPRVRGTIEYMSPEQSEDRPAGPASDLYAVGVMLYEALSGALPFAGDGSLLLSMKRSARPASLSALGIQVPAELETLCMDLLATNPAQRPALDEVLRRLHATTPEAITERAPESTPPTPMGALIGRATQLAELRALAEAVRADQPRMAIVSGPSGVGKTYLLQCFTCELERDARYLVLRGRCHERESVPYKAFDAVIDALTQELSGLAEDELQAVLPAELYGLSRMFPVLRRLKPIERRLRGAIASTDAHQQLREAWNALRELLHRIAGARRIVMSIEDLHWGDLESVHLLEQLFAAPNAPPLLVVGSARDEDAPLSPMLRALRSPSHANAEQVVWLRLAPLQTDEAEAVARSLLGDAASSELVRAIANESAGIPFFIDELAHFLTQRAHAEPPAVKPEAASASSAPAERVRLDNVLRQRIEGLSEGAQRTLALVASAGRTVRKRVIDQAAERPHAAVWLELANARLLRVSSDPDDVRVECYHDRVREALLGGLPSELRSRYHGALASAFDSLQCGEPEELLEHYTAAGLPARALEHAQRAAGLAFSALAFGRAARLYEAALALVPSDAADADVLLRKLADSLANAGRVWDAAERYAEAARRVDGIRAIELSRIAAQHYLTAGRPDRGVEMLRRALSGVGLPYPETRRAILFRLVSERLRIRVRRLRFIERGEDELSERERERLEVCFSAAAGFSMNDLLRNAAFSAWHLRLALDAGEPSRIARSLAFEIALAPGARGDGLHWALRHGLPLAERLERVRRDPYRSALLALAKGHLAYLTSEWVRAIELLGESDELFVDVKSADVHWARTSARVLLCCALAMAGDLTTLQARLPAFLSEAHERGAQHVLALLAFPRVLLELAADRPDQARAVVEEAAVRFPGPGFQFRDLTALHCALLIDRYEGAHARGWTRFEQHWRELERSDLLHVNVLRCLMLIERATAALGADRPDKEQRTLHALAASSARKLGKEPLCFASSSRTALLARIAYARGDSSAAIRALERASEGFCAARMPLHATCIQHEAALLRGGVEGRAAAARAETELRARGLHNPARFIQLLAPGFDGRRGSVRPG